MSQEIVHADKCLSLAVNVVSKETSANLIDSVFCEEAGEGVVEWREELEKSNQVLADDEVLGVEEEGDEV